MTDEGPTGLEQEWRQFERTVLDNTQDFGVDNRSWTLSRAPGRLDVLGGVADYSGSVVLEMPLGDAIFVAIQPRADSTLFVRSLHSGVKGEGSRATGASEARIPLASLLDREGLRSFSEVSEALAEPRRSRWAAYPTGCLYVLLASGWLELEQATGFNILIQSRVPIGAGVSSSAALEVATMSALVAYYGLQMDGLELARLCQIVENRVVGAPCGIMDQVTCAMGQADALLALKCQPHEVVGYPSLPLGWRFVGLDSGVKHSVGGRSYGRARIGAFMGLKIVQRLSGRSLDGYLANLSPEEWIAIREQVPESITGADFLEEYGELPDTATTVDPAETYRVRDCAEHPIFENARVLRFATLLEEAKAAPLDESVRTAAGRLLYEAHLSYSNRVDLGCAETDLLVEAARSLGEASGVYGGRITGGGSGGTVALLCIGDAAPAGIEAIRDAYEARYGRRPRLMEGSSPGAVVETARRMDL